MTFVLPELPYARDALQPFISEEMINEVIRKYDYKVKYKFTPDEGLTSYYTWYIISK